MASDSDGHNPERPKLSRGWFLYTVPGGGYVVRPHNLQYMMVNDSASRLLELCDGLRTKDDIIASLARRYRSTHRDMTPRVEGFLRKARSIGQIGDAAENPDPVSMFGDGSHWIPLVMSMEVTMRCPLRCSHCYVSAGTPLPEELGTERWLDLIEEAAEMGVLRAYITGGEPLALRGIDRLLERATARMIWVELATSGVGLRAATVDLLARAGNCSVQVSLDGPENVHNAVRGRPRAFRAALHAIRRLSIAGVPVRVAMTVRPDTIELIDETALIARDNGARFFRTGVVVAMGRADDTMLLSPAQIAEMEDRVAGAASALGAPSFEVILEIENLECLLPGATDPARNGNCGAGWLQANVQADGEVTPCLIWRLSLGNVRERSLSSVFASQAIEGLKALPAPGGDVCQGCPLVTRCGRCPALAISQGTSCPWGWENADSLRFLDALEPSHAIA